MNLLDFHRNFLAFAVLLVVGTAAAAAARAADQEQCASCPGPEAGGGKGWVQLISWQPRAFLYHNFLTDQEVHHIRSTAAPLMKRSTVAGDGNISSGQGILDEYRTSYGMFIPKTHDPIVEGIINRVAEWVRLPPGHFEDMQVLRYGVGQEYRKHQDSNDNEVDGPYGPRLCTVLLYLNDVPEGGETAFPDTAASHWADRNVGQQVDPSLSACAKGSVAYKPKRGDAFMFWSFGPDGVSMDRFAMHTGCPPVRGVKWTAPLWVHSRPFRPDDPGTPFKTTPVDPGICEDHHALCEEWAAAGECDRNRQFMLGDLLSHAGCPKACGQCTVCAAGDRACCEGNRRAAGYLVYTSEDDIDEQYVQRRRPAQQQQQEQSMLAGKQDGQWKEQGEEEGQQQSQQETDAEEYHERDEL